MCGVKLLTGLQRGREFPGLPKLLDRIEPALIRASTCLASAFFCVFASFSSRRRWARLLFGVAIALSLRTDRRDLLVSI